VYPGTVFSETNEILFVQKFLVDIISNQSWNEADEALSDSGRLSDAIHLSLDQSANEFRDSSSKSAVFALLKMNEQLFAPQFTNSNGRSLRPRPQFSSFSETKNAGYVMVCWFFDVENEKLSADDRIVCKIACFRFYRREAGRIQLDLWASAMDEKPLPFLLGFRRNHRTGIPELSQTATQTLKQILEE
jgi:hypothetical protein